MSRTYLNNGYCLRSKDRTYLIEEPIGEGALSIVYSAVLLEQEDPKLRRRVRIKECYPDKVALERLPDGTLITKREEIFEQKKERFEAACLLNLELQSEEALVNSTSYALDLFHANGTSYITYTEASGIPYDQVAEEKPHETIRTAITIGTLLARYHKKGYLYLDLKPENILILPETRELVLLVDFDSVVKVSDLSEEKVSWVSYTYDYAAPELRLNHLKQIGTWTDVYGLGAVVLRKLTGEYFDACHLLELGDLDLSQLKQTYPQLSSEFFEKLQLYFQKSLSSFIDDRFSNMEEAVESLKQLYSMAGDEEPHVNTNVIFSPPCFYGRDRDMEELSAMMRESAIVTLYGTGGIGKTTLALGYAGAKKANYDRILLISCSDGIRNGILDPKVKITGFSRYKMEKLSAFGRRKRTVLQRDLRENDLVIMDDLPAEELLTEDWQQLSSVNCHFLITSRSDLSDAYPAFHVSALHRDASRQLFDHYYHSFMESEKDEKNETERLLELSGDHPLCVELFAKYLRESGETPGQMLAYLSETQGLYGTENIDLCVQKDRKLESGNIPFFIHKLFEHAYLDEKQQKTLQLLSLMGVAGVSGTRFLHWTEASGKRELQQLLRSGWIDQENGRVFLSQLVLDYIQNEHKPDPNVYGDFLKRIISYSDEADPEESYAYRMQCMEIRKRIEMKGESALRFCVFYERKILFDRERAGEVVQSCREQGFWKLALELSYYATNCWAEDLLRADKVTLEETELLIQQYRDLLEELKIRKEPASSAEDMYRIGESLWSLLCSLDERTLEAEGLRLLDRFVNNLLLESASLYEKVGSDETLLGNMYHTLSDYYDPGSICINNIHLEEFADYVEYAISKVKSDDRIGPKVFVDGVMLQTNTSYIFAARDAFWNGDNEAALKICDLGLQNLPEDPDTVLLKAEILEDCGRKREAKKLRKKLKGIY